jgi:hypothetical protein
MGPRSMRLPCDRGSKTTFAKVGHQMGDRNLLFQSPCFRRHIKLLVPAVAVAPANNIIGTRGGLWPILFICNP